MLHPPRIFKKEDSRMKESKAPSLGRTPAQKFFDKWQGLFYLIPWIIGFVVFKAIPFGQSLYYSFTDMNFFEGIHEYGLMNYATAFTNAKITKALITTFKYAFITVPLKLIFALFIAYILNFKIACVNLFRTIYYIPSILGGSVAIAVLWKAVFRDDGLVNTLIRMITFGHAQGPNCLLVLSPTLIRKAANRFPPCRSSPCESGVAGRRSRSCRF